MFSVLFMKIRCELSKICGAEMLFIDMFGHDVQQPLKFILLMNVKMSTMVHILTFISRVIEWFW